MKIKEEFSLKMYENLTSEKKILLKEYIENIFKDNNIFIINELKIILNNIKKSKNEYNNFKNNINKYSNIIKENEYYKQKILLILFEDFKYIFKQYNKDMNIKKIYIIV
jgi:hypothetical protein